MSTGAEDRPTPDDDEEELTLHVEEEPEEDEDELTIHFEEDEEPNR